MEVIKTLVTPSMAKAILEKNISNRNVRQLKVNQYADEMNSGRWKEDTFEFIKISKSGNLIDGQHRLLAIIKANTSISMQIAYNVPDDVYSVLDTGINRNTGDVFKIEGIKNSCGLPSIIKFHDQIKNNLYSRNSKDYLTNFQTLEIYYKNPEFWQFVFQKSSAWYDSFAKILAVSLIGGYYAYFHSISPDDANNFFNELCTGRNISNETINLLRNTLLKDKMNMKRLPKENVRVYIVKSWNAYRSNVYLKVLKFNPETDNYPVAI